MLSFWTTEHMSCVYISDIQQVRLWIFVFGTRGTALVMAIISSHLPPADLILFILTHSQIYWVNFPAHINAEAPAAWHFTSAAEVCPRFDTSASWSGSVLQLQPPDMYDGEHSLFSVNHILDTSFILSRCRKLARGVKVWNKGVKTSISVLVSIDLKTQMKISTFWVVQSTVCHILQISRWAKWNVEQLFHICSLHSAPSPLPLDNHFSSTSHIEFFFFSGLFLTKYGSE